MMRLKQSGTRFPIVNYDTVVGVNTDDISSLLPKTLLCIIAARSTVGKTNFLLNLILAPKGIAFRNLILCSKTLHQPKYEFLERVLSTVPEITFIRCTDGTQFPPLRPDTVVVFDDVDKTFNEALRTCFTRGRHYGTSVFYLIQSYTSIEKSHIRDNATFIVAFPMDLRNLQILHRDHVFDLNFSTFVHLCRVAWKKPFTPIIIDKTREINNGRYRAGMDQFFEQL